MVSNILSLPLNLTPQDTYPYLGIPQDNIPAEISELIRRYLSKVVLLAQSRGIWSTFSVSEINDCRISLRESPLLIEGTNTVSHFITSERVSLFAVTIGNRVETSLDEISHKEPAHALIFDGIASAAVEHAAEQLDSLISREITRQGFFPTARFSPGYGDWLLSWQKPFLDSVEASNISLTCTSHFLLQPVKSITAAIGWSKIPVERSYLIPHRTKACQNGKFCNYCPLSRCPDRI